MEVVDVLFDIRFTCIIGIFIPLLIYWYSTKNYDYWKKRGVPFVKPYPFIGSFSGVFTKNYEDLEVERYNQLGKIYGIFEGHKPMISIADPEILRDILVKDFQYFPNRRVHDSGDPIMDKMMTILKGEDWKRVRTIVSPTFTTGKIKRMMSIFQDCAKILLRNFKAASIKENSVDVVKTYGAFTMDVIANSAFSTKIDSLNDPENDFVKHAREAFKRPFSFKLLLFLFIPGIMKMLKVRPFPEGKLNFFKTVAMQIIEERKKTGQTRNDFLQLMMDSASEVAKEEKWDEKEEDIVANYKDDSVNHPVFKNITTKHLTINELVAQCVVFFLAGYHTTTTTLGLVTYLLALNQDVQAKLFNEIKEVLNETDGELTYESVQKMKYLDNVISETLRLYSPLMRLERTADADYKLKDTGITVPKNMVVLIPIFAIHRDPKLFPEPERFNPDRFSPEEKEKQKPYSYLPFGAGPRNCVAMRFALIELKVCLVYVLSTFHIKKCSETKEPLEFNKSAFLLQPKSVLLCMDLREDCPLKA